MPAARSRQRAVRLVVRTTLGPGLDRARLLARLRAMLRALELEHVEISVLLTGDDQIRELNKLYRKKDKSTDVLAFAMREARITAASASVLPVHSEQPELLGDIIVSIPTARAQARRARRPALAEVTMLLAHGLLHLLGWDHDTPAKDRAMRLETERLCAAAAAARSLRGRRSTRSQPGDGRRRKLS